MKKEPKKISTKEIILFIVACTLIFNINDVVNGIIDGWNAVNHISK